VILFSIYIAMWAKKLFDACFLDAAFQHLILQFTSRHVPHRSSYKILCVIAGVTVVNAALNIQHRLVLSLHPLFVRFLCIQFSILFLYFALSSPLFISHFFMYTNLTCWGFVLLNSNVLTSRNTPRHVGEVIFKYSIYPSFISGLCHPAKPPPPLPPVPHEEVCRWPGCRSTAIIAQANVVAAPYNR